VRAVHAAHHWPLKKASALSIKLPRSSSDGFQAAPHWKAERFFLTRRKGGPPLRLFREFIDSLLKPHPEHKVAVPSQPVRKVNNDRCISPPPWEPWLRPSEMRERR